MAAATKKNAFAARLERAINASDKTQWEIANSLGYDNANIITMFKKGTTRVPPDKVAPLALALDIDPGELMREWFDTYMPEMVPAMEEWVGTPLSRAERSWISGLRRHLGRVPAFDDRWAGSIEEMVKAPTSAAVAA